MADGGAGDNSVAVSILRTIAQQISALVAATKSIFPQYTGTAPTATAGAATLPGNPVGFMTVSLNGTTVKIPYYAD